MNARDLIRRATGLNLTAEVAGRAVAERLARLGQSDEHAYLRSIAPEELKALTELVVVPESWMFRDPEAFNAVATFVRARLVAAPGRVVRILSIPCAGGEEPYSIAMALMDAAVPRSATVIEAIDLSEVALSRARRGRYTRNAFRGAELSFRERHFTQDGNEYQINQALRDQVSFSQGNLLSIDALGNAGRYDIVFCRNLLIYFDDATTATAIARLRLLLADDGMLFAGYAEVPAFCAHGFTPMRMPGAFALQKERRAEVRPRGQLRPAPAPAPAPALARTPTPARPPAPLQAQQPVQRAAQAADPAILLERARREEQPSQIGPAHWVLGPRCQARLWKRVCQIGTDRRAFRDRAQHIGRRQRERHQRASRGDIHERRRRSHRSSWPLALVGPPPSPGFGTLGRIHPLA